MTAYLNKLQKIMLFMLILNTVIIIGSWISLRWCDGKATDLLSPVFFLFMNICYIFIYAGASRSESISQTAALETRLAALEVELKMLNAKQPYAGSIGNDPV